MERLFVNYIVSRCFRFCWFIFSRKKSNEPS